MHIKTIAHRHAVLVPLFLAVTVVSTLSTAKREAQHASTVSGESEEFRTRNGVVGRREKGTSVSFEAADPVLSEGEVLLKGEGRVALDVPGGTLLGLFGGFSAIRHGDTITIAALTTPVLLVRDDGARLLVPVGYQWRGIPAALGSFDQGISLWEEARKVSLLPSDFRRRQLHSLEALPGDAGNAVLPPARSLFPAEPAFTTFLRFPAADQRAEGQWFRDVLGVVRGALESQEPERALEILRREDVRSTLQARRDQERETILVLAGRALTHAGVEHLLLPSVLTEDLALVLSVHPDFREVFWTLPEGEAQFTTPEGSAIAVLTFPGADMLPQGAADIAVRSWAGFADRVLKDGGDRSTALFEELTERMRTVISFAEQEQYAERTRRYADVLAALRQGRSVSPEVDREIQRLSALDSVRLTPKPAMSEASLQASLVPPVIRVEDRPSFDSRAVEALARQILGDSGALWSLKTTVEAVGPATASIRNIVFATPSGDKAFTFSLDTDSRTVQGIVQDGTTLPFAISLEQFLAWVRGE